MTKRALISVYEKDGIVLFAKKLKLLGWEIISTGGTYNLLRKEGIEVIEVDEVTNFKEILNGRVKTLHPFIHAGILYKRDNTEHVNTVDKLNISSIDMVVNNLYPFENVLKSTYNTHENLIENIDIGGPSMIRAAAKNYKDVIIVTDPIDYSEVLTRIENKELNDDYRLYLATKAFNYTAYYDSLISNYFNDILKFDFPDRLTLTYKKKSELRYGENPHQKASLYDKVYLKNNEKADFKQLHGKELSYNNLTDMYSAVSMVKEFEEPCVVAIKHNSPCGIAIDDCIDNAFNKAYECDSISIFGGIIAINREVTKYIAEQINNIFIEIVIASKFSLEALDILTKKKNIRLIEIPNLNDFDIPNNMIKEVLNGIVYQENDKILFIDDFVTVTRRKPNIIELKDLLFAFKACKCVGSNGVVIAKNNSTIGIGQSEVRRSWAVEQAIQRSKDMIDGAVLASDAFFFEDTVELLKESNIKAVIQPGGSIKDENVIKLCDEYGIAMIFTKTRHFRH